MLVSQRFRNSIALLVDIGKNKPVLAPVGGHVTRSRQKATKEETPHEVSSFVAVRTSSGLPVFALGDLAALSAEHKTGSGSGS